MGILKSGLCSACVLIMSTFALCQQESPPDKPKFGYFQCRTDAQKWTMDPFDTKDAKLSGGTAIMVNGQLRSMPHVTYHVTVGELLKRASEMDVCTHEDADFEKQFATYSSIYRAYSEERTFRYMYFLTKHNLDEQFHKEDAEEFK